MLKYILLSILTLTAALLILGCEPEPPAPAPDSPIITEPPMVSEVEPDFVEPSVVSEVEPEIADPVEPPAVSNAEPDDIELNSPAESETTEPNTTPVSPPPPSPIETKPTDVFNVKFAPIFETYINDEGLVDYSTLRRKKSELRNLFRELAELKPAVYEKWTTPEKIAFWINTYNLKMLDIIISNYPIESSRVHRLLWPPSSIRHIPPRNEVGPPKWNSYKFIVMDEEFTLTEIERRFFRNQFNDPRIFLALTLASKDSPPLRNEPYLGQSLDKQLNDQSKKFLASPSGFRFDRDKNRVLLSVVFEPSLPWYGKEFLKKYSIDKKFKSQPPAVRAVLNFATGYLPEAAVNYLETGNYEVRYKTYDWRLNEQ
jgi:hypothetical protein